MHVFVPLSQILESSTSITHFEISDNLGGFFSQGKRYRVSLIHSATPSETPRQESDFVVYRSSEANTISKSETEKLFPNRQITLDHTTKEQFIAHSKLDDSISTSTCLEDLLQQLVDGKTKPIDDFDYIDAVFSILSPYIMAHIIGYLGEKKL